MIRNEKTLKVVYGICEGITYPCFMRLVFQDDQALKVQVFDNGKLKLEQTQIDFETNKIITFDDNKYLDVQVDNYGIVLNDQNYVIGPREEISKKLDNVIENYDPYFQVEYYEFMNDYYNLMKAYVKLSNLPGVSSNTKSWAADESKKIKSVLDAIFTILEEYKQSYQITLKRYSSAALYKARKSRYGIKSPFKSVKRRTFASKFARLEIPQSKVNLLVKKVPKDKRIMAKSLISKLVKVEE